MAIATVAVGCKQQVFMGEDDYTQYRRLGLATPLDTSPPTGLAHVSGVGTSPQTVLDPDRPIRYISLAEAMCIAMEQGNIGNTSALFSPGFNIDNLVSFSGAGTFGDDNIRVLALDPAIQATDIEIALSKFDALWATQMTWNKTDRPVGTVLDSFQAQGSGQNALNITNANFASGLIKPLPTGGVAGITFSTNYELSNLQQRVNPAYRPVLQFEFEQPLLRGAGVAINQLTQTPPDRIGNTTSPFRRFFFDRQADGILISRVRFDQSRIEFERNVQFMLLNVEAAYWNLYGAYWTLYSREQGLRQAYEAWKINRARYEAGRINIQDFAQTRQQYELFRSQRITALGQVLEQERQLRGLLGQPTEDGFRLVPSDEPTLAPFQPDWHVALSEAINFLPGLNLAREEVKVRHLELLREQNRLLPDLRFISAYDINAIGSQLTGQGANNAFRNLASNHFNNWTLGLRMDVPLGFRNAHAAVRATRLQLLRAYSVLHDQELKAERQLTRPYRQLFEFHEQIKAQRAVREAAAQQLEARFEEFLAGRGTLDILLEAQRVWADALRGEYENIVNYNTALAQFQFAKGTILQYNNVVIAEGPLPHCAQVRAIEHEKEKTDSLIKRTRPVWQPRAKTPDGHELSGPPDLSADAAPPLPAIMGLEEKSELLRDKPGLPAVPLLPRSYSPVDSLPSGALPPASGNSVPPRLPSLPDPRPVQGALPYRPE